MQYFNHHTPSPRPCPPRSCARRSASSVANTPRGIRPPLLKKAVCRRADQLGGTFTRFLCVVAFCAGQRLICWFCHPPAHAASRERSRTDRGGKEEKHHAYQQLPESISFSSLSNFSTQTPRCSTCRLFPFSSRRLPRYAPSASVLEWFSSKMGDRHC